MMLRSSSSNNDDEEDSYKHIHDSDEGYDKPKKLEAMTAMLSSNSQYGDQGHHQQKIFIESEKRGDRQARKYVSFWFT